jgi:hypothetical protein
MEAFTHLSILVSIILGLGMTELLTGLGRLIERRRSARLYLPALSWAVLLLLIQIQTWWTVYGLRSHSPWTFLQFFVLLLQPITLYLLSVLTLPHGPDNLDLQANYFSHRRWFFGFFALLPLVSILKELAVKQSLPTGYNLYFHGCLFLIAAVGALSERDVIHKTLAYSTLLASLGYVAFLFYRLV